MLAQMEYYTSHPQFLINQFLIKLGSPLIGIASASALCGICALGSRARPYILKPLISKRLDRALAIRTFFSLLAAPCSGSLADLTLPLQTIQCCAGTEVSRSHILFDAIFPSLFGSSSPPGTIDLHLHQSSKQMLWFSPFHVPILSESLFFQLFFQSSHFDGSSYKFVFDLVFSRNTRYPSQHVHFLSFESSYQNY